jgi:hypothetical protein
MADTHFSGPIATTEVGAVTQLTNISTGVTLNAASGIITTVSSTLAALLAATAIFVVTNDRVEAGDTVVLSCATAGTGSPVALATNVAAGSFEVCLSNGDPADALNAVVTINFVVLKTGPAATA